MYIWKITKKIKQNKKIIAKCATENRNETQTFAKTSRSIINCYTTIKQQQQYFQRQILIFS